MGIGNVTGRDEACLPGDCVIATTEGGHRYCRRCGFSTQTLVAGTRHGLPGDFRVVCNGPSHDDDETACPIGPSEPTPHITTAKERLDEHQASAKRAHHWCEKCQLAVPGIIHDAKIVQL